MSHLAQVTVPQSRAGASAWGGVAPGTELSLVPRTVPAAMGLTPCPQAWGGTLLLPAVYPPYSTSHRDKGWEKPGQRGQARSFWNAPPWPWPPALGAARCAGPVPRVFRSPH